MSCGDDCFLTMVPTAISGTIGPPKNTKRRRENVVKDIGAPVSKRITDPSLLESLNKDMSFRIRPPRSARSPRSPRIPQPAVLKFPKREELAFAHVREAPEIDECVQEFINNPAENMPDNPEDCRYILHKLRKERSYLIDQNKYVEAQVIHRSINILEEKMKELDQSNSSVTKLKHTVARHQEIEQIISRYLSEWENVYSDFVSTTDEELERMEAEYQEELQEFDSNIPTELIVELRKPSAALLDMRSKERRLALANRLISAHKLQLRADALEEEEARNAFKKQQEMIQKRRQRLIDDQKLRRQNYLDHAKATKHIMLKERNRAVEGYLKRLNLLDNEIDKGECRAGVTASDVCGERIDEERAGVALREEMRNKMLHFKGGQAFTSARKNPDSARRSARSNRSVNLMQPVPRRKSARQV